MTRLFGKLLLVAVAVGFFAAQAALANDQVKLPFTQRAQQTEVSPTDCVCGGEYEGWVPVKNNGVGVSTQLGKTKSWSCACFGACEVQELGIPSCPFVVTAGEVTTENKDKINTYGGRGRVWFGLQAEDGCHTSVPVVIYGGTGRFENARGWAAYTGFAPWVCTDPAAVCVDEETCAHFFAVCSCPVETGTTEGWIKY